MTSLKSAARLVKNPIPVIQETMNQLGPTYIFHMGGRTKGLITKDLEIIQHVVQKNHKNYQKSKLQTNELGAYIGKGLLTNNGDSWLRQRRLIQPAFNRNKINALANIMEEEVKKIIQHEIGEGGKTDITHFSAMLTFHIIARAFFSDEVSNEQIMEMRDRVERVQQMIILQVRQPFKKWFYSASGMIRKHKRLAFDVKTILRELIVNRQQSSMRKEDMLQFMLDTRYEDTGEGMTVDQLIDELIILVVAGHETTAHCLTWTLCLLNQHKTIRQHVLAEIDEVKTDYMQYFKPDSWLMATIKESLRMYPPAWVLDRVGLENDEVGNYSIPKDTILMLFVHGLHYDEKHWENPKAFNPDRFRQGKRHEAYFPFGAGPRLCIGNHFAYLELVIALVNLLSRYRLADEKINFPEIKPLITLQPKNQVWMKLEKL